MVPATIAARLNIGLPHVLRRKLVQRNLLMVIATSVVHPIIGLAHVQRRKLQQQNHPMVTATDVDRLIIGYQPVLIQTQNSSQMKELLLNNLAQKLRGRDAILMILRYPVKRSQKPLRLLEVRRRNSV